MREVLQDRIGKPMNEQVLSATGQPAAVRYACKINGFPEGRRLILEYAADAQGSVYVQLTRQDSGRKSRGKNHWSLEAIKDRDAKGLVGFVEFAKGLGIKGHQLANIVCEHNRGG